MRIDLQIPNSSFLFLQKGITAEETDLTSQPQLSHRSSYPPKVFTCRQFPIPGTN
jgi:hypothetical protein